MFIATLLAGPARANLDRAAVESLRNAWAGGPARWLSPGVAAEFPLAELPANRWEAWEALQCIGVDLVVQPMRGAARRCCSPTWIRR